MVKLPDDEKSLRIHLFVLIQYTNVTDGQTDVRTDGQTYEQKVLLSVCPLMPSCDVLRHAYVHWCFN